MKKISLIIFLLIYILPESKAQDDSLIVNELSQFAVYANSNFKNLPEDVLRNVTAEMVFVMIHIRDSAIASIDVFTSKDTSLKKPVGIFFSGISKKYRFKNVINHDYIIPLVIKNIANLKQKKYYDFDYLRWWELPEGEALKPGYAPSKLHAPRRNHRQLGIITSWPVYIFLSTMPPAPPHRARTTSTSIPITVPGSLRK